jgi:hypothetical protein
MVSKVMNKKTAISLVSGVSALILAATCFPALAFGSHSHAHHRGGHGDDMKFAMYARADGITHDQIRTAFQTSNVKTDFQNVHKDKKAMDACIIAGTCTNEVTTYETDEATLTKDKLAVWQGLFQTASNKTPGVNLKSSLDSLNQQKHAAFKTAFGGSSTVSPTVPSTQQ